MKIKRYLNGKLIQEKNLKDIIINNKKIENIIAIVNDRIINFKKK